MIANCCKYKGVQSTLAPLSQTPTIPWFIVGKSGQKAGLLTPLIRPIFITAPASIAPVEPMLTKALTDSSFLSSSNDLYKELFVLCRIASVGLSLQVISSGACTIETLFLSYSSLLSSSLIFASSPTKIISISSISLIALIAPSIFTVGLLSPPKVSTKIFII